MQKNSQQKWEDLGVYSEEKSDYPDQAEKLCKSLLKNPSHKGVLICGSGQGMAIKANRFAGIRAIPAYDTNTIQKGREHNNVNVLCLGARRISLPQANRILKVFLRTSFLKGRHLKRVKKLK